jgi:acyl-CoA reductase-like NAD-dependent aldehyde dehydrogenase
MNEYKIFIHGNFVDGRGGRGEVINPHDNSILAKYHIASKEDVDLAVKSAREGFEKWKNLSINKRIRILQNLSKLLSENLDKIAQIETLNVGKPINASKTEISAGISVLEFYIGAINKIMGETIPTLPGHFNYTIREPIGVCALIVPWNYPLMLTLWKLSPALACGNSVIIKPASWTPLSALELAKLCKEAGIPDGVVNVITGPGNEIGSYLVSHEGVDKISFTGETKTGSEIMKLASNTIKRVSLELGGKSANIVFEDADLEDAINGSIWAIYYNSGQSCEARSRLFIHKKIYDKFLSEFVEKTKKIKIGNPINKETQMGPLVSKSHLNSVHKYVEKGLEEGAKLIYGGKKIDSEDLKNGNYYMPTILELNSAENICFKEEIFGPVVVIMSFEGEEEAIKLANNSKYGLAGTIWTRDVKRAIRVSNSIRAGSITINHPLTAIPGLPFGGYKQSGFGRELSLDAIELFTEKKSVIYKFDETPVNPWNL